VANGLSGTVSRISPATNRTAEVPIGNGPVDVCVLGRSVWVADAYDNSVVRLDPVTHRLTTVDLEAAPTRVACGARSVWVTSRSNGTVTEVDAQTATPRATVHTGQGASGVALQGRSLWVANTDDGTVSRVDRRRRVQTAIVALGPRSGPTDVAVGGGGVWVASGQSGTLTRIDPSRAAVDRTLSIARRAEGLAVADRALWAAVRTTGGHHRGGTLRVAVPPEIFPPEDAAALDPATTYYALGTQLLGLTNDGLVTFARVGGREGETVVADLAEAVPEPTDGGRTYTFRLRSGLRYATGAPIRASHLRHAIERFLRRGAIPPHFYTGIRGAAACARRPASCDLSSGIEVDDRARTITFRLVAPDGDFLSKLALPFAVAIPPEIGGATLRRPVPATGPYAISRIDKRLVRMMRNPYFRPVPGRPAAYPDAIELHHASDRTAVREVEEGRADYVNGLATAAVPREDAATIATRFPGQMHGTLLPALNYMVLNTRVRPFDDVRVRRAVNFAVDRDAVTRISGGALGAEPACQLVPPNFPGRRPYCPYTRDAGSGRPWTGPDLPRARRLIAAAHVRGMRVTVVGATVGLDREARYMTGVLNRLGFRARTRLLPANRYFAERRDPDRREQISVGNWGADYPSPATFLQTLFGCAAMRGPIGQRLNRAQFCDARAERLMARAGRLPAGTPESDAAWVRAERRMLDQAPAVPLTYGHEEDLVSARVRHYAFNFQDGPLLEQMWVR
jgi:ABC-type transport system substrate-binding protein